MYHNTGDLKHASNPMAQRRALGVDSSLVLKFIATSFVYLLAGLIFFTMQLAQIVNIQRDSIFVLWLFGFVAMIIFGLSYMFSSGLSRSSALINSTVTKEYVLLNAGVIGFFSGFSGLLPVPVRNGFAIVGLLLIIISVSLHLLNLVLVATARKTTKIEKQTFKDEY